MKYKILLFVFLLLTGFISASGQTIKPSELPTVSTLSLSDYFIVNRSSVTSTITLGNLQGILGNFPGTSLNGQIVLFSGTTGHSLIGATTSGLLKATGGVLAPAVPGTDYLTPSGGALASVQYITAGTGTATITNGTDVVILDPIGGSLAGNLTLTAPLSVNFPLSRRISIVDPKGVIGVSTYTVSVQRAGTNTLNNGTAPLQIADANFFGTTLIADGVSKIAISQIPITAIENYESSTLTLDAPVGGANGVLVYDTTVSPKLQLYPGTDLLITTGTINLSNTGVAAGSYTNSNVTVNAKGRITSISNGTGGGGGGGGPVAFVPLTDASPIVVNPVAGRDQQNYTLTIGSAFGPSHQLQINSPQSGQNFTIEVKQGTGGSQTLKMPTGSMTPNGGNGTLSLSSAVNAMDILKFHYNGVVFVVDSVILDLTAGSDITVDLWEDFEFTAPVTDVKLAANDHSGGALVTWLVTDVGSSLGINSQNLPVPLSSVNGNSTATGTSSFSINDAVANALKIRATYTTTQGPNPISYGFSAKVPTMAADGFQNMFQAGTNTAAICRLHYVLSGGVYSFRLSNNGQTTFSSSINASAGSVYFFSILVQQSATCRLRVYDSAGSQVGTEVTLSGGAQAQDTFQLGVDTGHAFTSSTMLYDNLLVKLSGSYPLGP